MTLGFLRFGAMALAGVAAACTGSITGPDGSSDPDMGGVTPGGPGSPGAVASAAQGKLNLNGSPS